MKFVLPVAAAILPFFLWPIELIFPYPYFVEEFAKGVLILLMLKDIDSAAEGVRISLILGLLFAISESVLYIFNIQLVGNLSTFLVRLAVTIPLHSFTSIVIFVFAYTKKVFPLLSGLVIAMVLHFLFNSLIPYLQL